MRMEIIGEILFVFCHAYRTWLESLITDDSMM